MRKHIAVLATLDTKGVETGFVRDLIRNSGHVPLIVDCGIKGEPAIAADLSREDVAAAAGSSIAELLARADKNAAIETMARGAAIVAVRLHAENQLDGILGLGGVQGTMISTRAMQALPVGVPKMMLSAVANGQATFGPFIGTKDIAIMHSVADIMGLNVLTRKVLREAAGAVIGMVALAGEEAASTSKPTIGLTMAGVTTATAMAVRERLEADGYEVIGFHCNGIGAKAMEDLVADGAIDAVVDLSPHDIGGYLRDGLMRAMPDRLQATVASGVPLVFVPGGLDFVLKGPIDSVPELLRQRAHVIHNPIHTHIRASRDEMAAAGRFVGERVNAARGAVRVLLPLRGFSQLNIDGGPLRDPEADAGFAEGLRETDPGADVRAVDLHINDPAFAELLADIVKELAPIAATAGHIA